VRAGTKEENSNNEDATGVEEGKKKVLRAADWGMGRRKIDV